MPSLAEEKDVVYRYKYAPFDAGALKMVTEGTIKFSDPRQFNDPFDCFPIYGTQSLHRVPNQKSNLFRAAGNRRGYSPAQRLQRKGEFVARLKARVEDGSFASDILNRIGIVCLSKNPLNILMWSHYANFHKGMVLEFRIPVLGDDSMETRLSELLVPTEVSYVKERPHIELAESDGTSNLAMATKALCTKCDIWEYEEEERVIALNRLPGIYPYARDEILSSVIAGMKMPESDYAELNSAVKNLKKSSHLPVELYKAIPVSTGFQLTVPGHPRVN